jgi:hypothetical protein
MRKTIAILILALIGCAVANANDLAARGAVVAPPAEVPDPTAALPPQAVFPETEYHFEPILEGQEITHDFIVENQGRGELIIQSVRPD